MRARVYCLQPEASDKPYNGRGSHERVKDRCGQARALVIAQPVPADSLGAHLRAELPPPNARIWTDDYSNILSVFRWHW